MEQFVSKPATEPLVSLIIPVFNTGERMRRCLDSALNQTWKNLEILIVNDGSTDEVTLNIIKEYENNDSRVHVLHNLKNTGLAFSRNVGEEFCHGDFLSFVDSDDILTNEFVSRTVSIMQANNTDFALSSTTKGYEDTPLASHTYHRYFDDIPILYTQDLLKSSDLLLMTVTVHGRMFRTSSYKKANIKFEGKTRNWEDNIWTFLCFFKLKTLSTIKYTGYHYLNHSSSYLHTKSLSKALSMIDLPFQIYRFCTYFGYKVDKSSLLIRANGDFLLAYNNLTPKQDRKFVIQYMIFTLKRCGFTFETNKVKATKLLQDYKVLLKISVDSNRKEDINEIFVKINIYQNIVNWLTELNLDEIPPMDEETYFKHYVELYRPEEWLSDVVEQKNN